MFDSRTLSDDNESVLCRMAQPEQPAMPRSPVLPQQQTQHQQRVVEVPASLLEVVGLEIQQEQLVMPFNRQAQQHLLQQQQQQWQAAKGPDQGPSWTVFERAVQAGMPDSDWQACQVKEAQAVRLIGRTKWRLSKFQTPDGQLHCTQQEFLDQVQQTVLPAYRAGGLSFPGHCKAVHTLLDDWAGSGDITSCTPVWSALLPALAARPLCLSRGVKVLQGLGTTWLCMLQPHPHVIG